ARLSATPGLSACAASTTRPVSAGKFCAPAGAASATSVSAAASTLRMVAAMPMALSVCSRAPSELDLRVAPDVLGDREFRHRLAARVERLRPEHARNGAQLGVVDAHRLDVVAPRHRDAVLGAFELRLQGEEVLVRLELGIALADREQAAERAGELRLCVLEFLERIRIVDEVGRRLKRGRAAARRGDLLEHLALLPGKALNGLDQVGNEIGAALVLVLDLRPFRLRGLLVGRDVVDAATGHQKTQN